MSPTPGDRGDAPQRRGPGRGQIHRGQFGRSAPGDRRRCGHVAQGVPPVADPRPPAADDATLDPDRPVGLDQLADDRSGQGLPGPDSASRPEAGQAPDQRPNQWVTAKAAMELAEVVVDAEREAHPLDRQLQLSLARRGRILARSGQGRSDRRRIDRLRPQRRSGRSRLPGPHQHRAPLHVEKTGGDSTLDPQRPIVAPPPEPKRRSRRHLHLKRRGQTPADGPICRL